MLYIIFTMIITAITINKGFKLLANVLEKPVVELQEVQACVSAVSLGSVMIIGGLIIGL